MKYPLSITWVETNAQGHGFRSRASTVMAETDFTTPPQVAFLPASFVGKLVDIKPELLTQLAGARGIIVGFSSKRYKFGRLDEDGTFELCRDWEE